MVIRSRKSNDRQLPKEIRWKDKQLSKTLYINLRIEQHQPHDKTMVKSCAPKG